jgi:hypothetical protein
MLSMIALRVKPSFGEATSNGQQASMSLLAELLALLRYRSIEISLLRSWGPHRLNEAQSRITLFNSLLDRNLRNLCNLRIVRPLWA